MEGQGGFPTIGHERSKGKEAIQFEIHRARRYFSRAEVVAAAEKQAQTTLLWMRKNTQSYTEKGNLCKDESWWPVPEKTSCRVLKATRKRVLLDRAYEHGILHFLRGLEESKTIDTLVDRIIDTVVGAMTPVVLNQLVAKRYSPEEKNDGVSLSKLSMLFGNGQNTSPAKVRDKYLGDLSLIGLFSSRENDGYDISVGLVGRVFFVDVFALIVDEMDLNYEEAEALAA
jgi:hypothetical protein